MAAPILSELVLFDLDGTITDPVAGITASMRHALTEVGHPVDDATDLTWIVGPPLRENLVRLDVPAEHHDAAVASYRARHLDVGLYEATLVPGMVDVLEALLAAGRRLALATAKPEVQARMTLEHFGIDHCFEAVGCASLDGTRTSKAAIVADALDQLGADSGAGTVMVGDRRHDVDGGRANGCVTVAVLWGYAEDHELDDCRPDHRAAVPADLLELLIGS